MIVDTLEILRRRKICSSYPSQPPVGEIISATRVTGCAGGALSTLTWGTGCPGGQW